MSQILYRGTVIWDSSTNGVGWSFRPVPPVASAIEKKAPLGVGYWVLPDGVESVSYTLELQWRSATPAVIESLVRGVSASATRGTLVVPAYGTYQNCRLSAVSELDSFRSDEETGYITRGSLTFTEYP